MPETSYTRRQLADAAGIGLEALRFYEQRQLLPEPPRGGNGYRYYPAENLLRLQFITRAKQLGFTLDEVLELLSLRDNQADRGSVKALARQKVTELDTKIADLQRMRKALAEVTGRCSGTGSAAGCPIILSLSGVANHHGHEA